MPTRNVCLPHARHDGQFDEDEAAVADLLQRSRSLDTPRGVSRALATLFCLTAAGKIPPRRSAQLAYIGHLLLYGLSCDRKATQRAARHEQLAAEVSATAAAPSQWDDATPLAGLPPLPVGPNGAAGANGNGSHS